MSEQSMTWAQLVALMTVGGDGPEPALSGLVRVRDVVPVGEDEVCDLAVDGHGRYRFTESVTRVLKRGTLVRRELPDGTVRAIEGTDTMWIWLDDDTDPTAFPRATTAWGWPDSSLIQRHAFRDWQGDDFTHAAGPPRPVEFLGRHGWQVELQPPPHKPYPVTLVIDAETGLVLSQRNEGFHIATEWVDLQLGVTLPDELFVWTGPATSHRDGRSEHEAEMARRRDWLRANGVGRAKVELPIEVTLHVNDDDGGFEASISVNFQGSLARRRHSEEPWELPWRSNETHRWTTDEWDWALGTDETLDGATLDRIERQLGHPE